jgi:hypothetical protein
VESSCPQVFHQHVENYGGTGMADVAEIIHRTPHTYMPTSPSRRGMKSSLARVAVLKTLRDIRRIHLYF